MAQVDRLFQRVIIQLIYRKVAVDHTPERTCRPQQVIKGRVWTQTERLGEHGYFLLISLAEDSIDIAGKN